MSFQYTCIQTPFYMNSFFPFFCSLLGHKVCSWLHVNHYTTEKTTLRVRNFLPVAMCFLCAGSILYKLIFPMFCWLLGDKVYFGFILHPFGYQLYYRKDNPAGTQLIQSIPCHLEYSRHLLHDCCLPFGWLFTIRECDHWCISKFSIHKKIGYSFESCTQKK